VNFDQLQRELEAAVQKNPQLALKIRADKQAPTGEFLRVIDAGKLAKVQSIDAITEKARQ
jgi:biopolymer transport protein ExbD